MCSAKQSVVDMDNLKFRHEWKHEINAADRIILRQRLAAVMRSDPNAQDGKYMIRSLYFDNINDKALFEKINEVPRREKFRIRYYNDNTEVINLEKKSKIDGLCNKQSCQITAEEAQAIVDGDYNWMLGSDRELIRELYVKMTTIGLRPKTIVDYTREPFVYAPGNVRVTIDYDIRTGNLCTDFLNPDCVTMPAARSPIILEVKWDEYLPDVIRDIVQLGDRHAVSFSKYVACRNYF